MVITDINTIVTLLIFVSWANAGQDSVRAQTVIKETFPSPSNLLKDDANFRICLKIYLSHILIAFVNLAQHYFHKLFFFKHSVFWDQPRHAYKHVAISNLSAFFSEKCLPADYCSLCVRE